MNVKPGPLMAVSLFALLPLAPAIADDDPNLIAAQARGVLRQYCHRCHHGEGSEGGDFDFLKHPDLVRKVGGDQPLVVAGKPDESYLFERVVKNQMPPKSIRERPSTADKEILRKWIAAGAPVFVDAAGPQRKFITLPETLAAVRDHLQNSPRSEREHLRYFTLTHLHNNPNVLDDDLRLYRAALSKAINSLSWEPNIIRPESIDKTETVLVVNVRHLGWNGDLWRAVMAAYPYGLKYRNHPTEDLRKLDEEICNLTVCDMPLVRADWFVATATRPPLYHTLLQIPKTAGQLEKRLGVSVRDNFEMDNLARAAFAKSGVSGQNRLVERHATTKPAGGAYWKSYDFKPDAGRAKLVRFPLGPLNLFPEGKHPFAGQAFIHDGGEIIFSLPNGLQGYMLINGKDERIDEGPVQVVSDSLKTSGTPSIFTGLSCMACHKHGMIELKDTIRDANAVFGDAEKKVRKLYVEVKRMSELVQQDEKRFLDALEKCIGAFLRAGPDAKKPLKEFPEPIGEVARTYRIGFLDAKAVACELDLVDPNTLLIKVGETNLKKLGLEPLLKGGVISRLEWEAVDGSSLMQEVARVLRYTPFEVSRRRE